MVKINVVHFDSNSNIERRKKRDYEVCLCILSSIVWQIRYGWPSVGSWWSVDKCFSFGLFDLVWSMRLRLEWRPLWDKRVFGSRKGNASLIGVSFCTLSSGLVSYGGCFYRFIGRDVGVRHRSFEMKYNDVYNLSKIHKHKHTLLITLLKTCVGL